MIRMILNLSTTILMSVLLGISLGQYIGPLPIAIYVIPIVLILRVITIVKYT
jgi:hypothetical protein